MVGFSSAEQKYLDLAWTALSLPRSDLVCFIEPSPSRALSRAKLQLLEFFHYHSPNGEFCSANLSYSLSLVARCCPRYLPSPTTASKPGPSSLPRANFEPAFRIITTILIAFLPDQRHSLSRRLCPLLYATTYALPNLSLFELRWW